MLLRWALVSAAFNLLCTAHAGDVKNPIWAKDAVAVEGRCIDGMTSVSKAVAPDGLSVAEIRCGTYVAHSDDPVPILRIQQGGGAWEEFALDWGVDELLWASDSHAVFINGGENAYTKHVLIFHFQSGAWRKLEITEAAQKDMVASFPPCLAANHDAELCKRVEANPEFNMVGIAWDKNGSSIIVMGEVPPSSSYGGIMGQVLGYELSVPDGKIAERMTATDFKKRWQRKMAWSLSVPEPPAFDR